MGVISLDYVISYSSQDETYKATNLLQNPGSGKPWLCAPDDKSCRLVAEFQLCKSSRIDFIDIGNYGCSTVEIQVGRSSYHSKTQYVSFLPAVTLLSLADLKEGVDRNAVYMFNKSNLNEAVASDKWDRIKVICCQPYRRNTQFGLSFLSLRTNELATELSINGQSMLNDKNDRSPFKRSKEYGSNITFTRGQQLLNASRSKQNDEKPRSHSFEEDISVFLIACLGEENENKTLEDYMKEFEEQSQQNLNTAEKVIFRMNYMKIRGNAFISDYKPSDSFSRNQDSRVESSPSNPKSDCNKSEIPSFDLQLSTPARRKLSDSDEADKMKRALKRLKTPAKPSKIAEILNISPEDFIQSDGVQPSTSSGVTYVDCPICREFFPSDEIERHASTCGDLTADVEYLYSSKPNALHSEDKEETFITCLFCDEMHPQKNMSLHLDQHVL
ncbi:putative short transient receptor potential like protein [Argiope bruennichi]|uniref:Putative short transient receptor potential like protein n=1 Tax=Argiope bruennichi TaxID=94029 RepID=A0A8T0FEB4_ARGBR|nr:putative short transient receptor potential like protein [Argiope bruennichi]